MNIEQLKQRYIKALVEEAAYVEKIRKIEQEYFDNIPQLGEKDPFKLPVHRHPTIIQNMYRTKSTKYTREVKIAEKLLVKVFLKGVGGRHIGITFEHTSWNECFVCKGIGWV